MKLALLRTRPEFRRLWSARVVSLSGDVLATTALVLYIEASTGSPVAVGALLVVVALPNLFGPLLGTVADRADLRTVMLRCDLAQAVIYTVIALWLPPLPILLGLVLGAATVAALFRPANRSAVPLLVGNDEIPIANALSGGALGIGLAAGPAVAGLLFARFGAQWTLGLNVVSFVVSAMLVGGLQSLPSTLDVGRGFWADVREGLSAVRGNPVLRVAVPGLLLGVFFLSIDNVANVFLVRDELGEGAQGYGAFLAVQGAAMLVGSFTVAGMFRWMTVEKVFAGSMIVGGLGNAITGVAPTLVVAFVGAAIAGFANGMAVVTDDTLVMQRAPVAIRGRVFGLLGSGAIVGQSMAGAAGGPIINLTSVRATLLISGAGALATAIWLLAVLPKRHRSED